MSDFAGYIANTGERFSGSFTSEGAVGPIGPQGEPGYDPVRGVDYWTPTDQATIIAEATVLINGKVEEYNANAEAKTTAFNSNATAKTTTYDNNAEAKLSAYNTNATSKLSAYNSNASDKVSAYNSNAESKTSDFDDNADEKTGTYNSNASSKLETYNNNASEKVAAYNSNATSKTETYNTNHTSSLAAYNSNATSKTNAFDTNASDKTTAYNTNATSKLSEYNTNASDKTTAFNSNAQDKVDYYNENADELIAFNEELLDQIPKATAEGTAISINDSSNLPLADIQIKGNATQTTTSIAGGDEYDSPTPDHPQPISVVTGDNTVNVYGKNFIKFINGTKSSSGITGELNNGVVTLNGTATANAFIQLDRSSSVIYYEKIPAGTYTFSANNEMIDGNVSLRFVNESGAVVSGMSLTINAINRTLTFALTEDVKKVRLQVRIASGTTLTDFILKPQLELGSTATAYEPYTEQTQLISLGNIELAKIGNYQDYIYKSEGKWYKYGAINKIVLDGTESTLATANTGSTNIYYKAYFTPPDITLSGSNSYLYIKSNQFQHVPYNQYYNELAEGISRIDTASNDRIYFAINKNRGVTGLTTFKTWLSTNTPILYYPLATPTITEITDTTLVGQLDNLLAMKTNRNITNAFTVTDNETPTLAVLYRQDLTTLFNKVELLEARLELLEG